MRATAVALRGHIGAIVRGHFIARHFNGVLHRLGPGPCNKSELVSDADITTTYQHNGDDALEPERTTSINQRFRNNTVDSISPGCPLAPYGGSHVVLRNTFTNYSAKAFKWDGKPNGIVLVYSTRAGRAAADIRAMDMSARS